jgi:hypothetical protein
MTGSDPIPDELRRFVLTSIPSVPYLEAMLLLQRAPADSQWSASDIARRLYIPEQKAAQLLEALCESGVAARVEGAAAYHYRPADTALGETVQQLELLYARHLLEITSLIHNRPDKRARLFADAFRWKKDS